MMNMYVDQQGFRYRTQISTYEITIMVYLEKVSIESYPIMT